MRPPAIICLVWDNFVPLLDQYLAEQGPLTLLTPSIYSGNALAQTAARHKCLLLPLEQLLDSAAQQAIAADLDGLRSTGPAYLAGSDWASLGLSPGASPLAGILAEEMDAELPAQLTLLHALERAAESYAIKLTLVIEDLTCAPKTAVLWSRRRGIPSLHFLHGVGLSRPYTVHRELHADVLAVYGQRSLETYLDQGIAADRCRVIGNPIWDPLIARRSQRDTVRRVLCAKYGFDAAQPIVTFATTWAANLTAVLSEDLFGTTVAAFLAAVKELRAQGLTVNAVIKDRPVSAHLGIGKPRVEAIAAELGLSAQDFVYTKEDGRDWVVASDVLVGVDSNILVEAMMVATPAVNILTDALCRLGPSFDADSGILECEAHELGLALERILRDAPLRMELLAQMQAAAPRYNAGVDGKAAARLTALMTEMALPSERVAGRYTWESLLDVEHSDASQYHAWAQSHLFDLFKHPPRRLLDIGCAAGGTGHAAKQAYPGCTVFGIEVNRAAAEVAATCIDHVAIGRFEDIDLEAFGITAGSIDTVIVADVLEHMYDPWHVMVRLRPYLSPDAQVIASIPNIRNLWVMAEMAKGNWRYEPWGLLDITHIRFFTPREAHRFFHETGYRVTEKRFNIDRRLADYYNGHRHEQMLDVEFDRLVLKSVTQDELAELCSLQVHIRAEPGAVPEEEFAGEPTPAVTTDYELWREARVLRALETDLWEQRLATWPAHPRVHLVIAASGAGLQRLGSTLNSATRQLYHNVALTVVADAPPPEAWHDSETLRWRHGDAGLLAGVNAALLERPADWLGVIDAGDALAQHSLLFMLEAAHAHADWQLIYSDEDVLTAQGEHLRPHFKPDINVDLLRSYPYVGGLLLISRGCFAALGGFADDMLGIEDHDLVLRALERVGRQGIGHVAEVLLHRAEGGGHACLPLGELCVLAQRAVSAHLQRMGLAARVEPGILPLSQQVVYQHPQTALVSLLVVASQDVERLQRSLEAVLGKTSGVRYEVLLLDANSTDPDLRAYVARLAALGDPRIKAFRLEQDASLSAFHNMLAGQAEGEFLLFLHADATPLRDDWLTLLLAHGQRAGVGAVGPRLLGADGKVRCAAMILGVDGGAETAFCGLALDDPGYFGRALVEQNVGAVGGGAMLTRRSVFETLGGFDATLAADVAEVDYCLRLAEHDLAVVWTPIVSLLCEGGAQAIDWRAPAAGYAALQPRWLKRLGRDAAYNRNLKRESGAAFAVEARTTLNWDPLPWKPLPRILAKPGDSMGCGQYRIFGPARALSEAGRAQTWIDFNGYSPLQTEPLELDTLVFQRQVLDGQIEVVERYQRNSKILRVFELDDLLSQLPTRSVHHGDMPKDIAERLRRVVPLCDRFVVSTEPLVHAYRGLNDDIRVVPNMLEKTRWLDLRPRRRQSQRARVGWVGGVGHTGDLEMIADVVRELAGEVDWVFMGMCPDALKGQVREFHAGTHFDQYPKKMADLNLDLAIAPLQINAFNEAKSNLRLLEYGILGFPVICSDIYPYQGEIPVTRVRNRSTDWAKAIREQVADLDECARRGDALRQHVIDHWMLEDHLDQWLKAWLP